MAKFKGIKSLPADARYREGNHGEVDIFDEKIQVFTRVDEGDDIKPFGTGYTVVSNSDPRETNPYHSENPDHPESE